MNLGKYGFLTPEETKLIKDYFRTKYGEEIAGDVSWPGPEHKIGFASAEMMFESQLISDKEQNNFFDNGGAEAEDCINCGFWNIDDSGIGHQAIFKMANGTFEYDFGGGRAVNLTLPNALRMFNMDHVPTQDERLLALKTLSHETYLMVAQHLDPDILQSEEAGWCEQYLEDQLLKAYKSGQGL